MKNKKCKKCGEVKSLAAFYKHPETKDGRMGTCKYCKNETETNRWHKKKKDPKWRDKERKRSREKYRRLNYKEKHKQTSEEAYERTKKYRSKYPEKTEAVRKARRKADTPDGHENHHWSYKIIHQTDVIFLKPSEHAKAHRYLVYDKKEMQYRDPDGRLLDSRKKHISFLKTKGIDPQEFLGQFSDSIYS